MQQQQDLHLERCVLPVELRMPCCNKADGTQQAAQFRSGCTVGSGQAAQFKLHPTSTAAAVALTRVKLVAVCVDRQHRWQ
jgi:hypothetical protein